MSKPPARKPESDVRRKAVLPRILGAGLQPNRLGTSSDVLSEAYLDTMEEDLNKRVDVEVEVLVTGLAELVALAKIDGKDHYQVAAEAFQAQCRSESMIRASHNLLSLSHTLKLLHLFSDTAAGDAHREKQEKELTTSISSLKAQLDNLLST